MQRPDIKKLKEYSAELAHHIEKNWWRLNTVPEEAREVFRKADLLAVNVANLIEYIEELEKKATAGEKLEELYQLLNEIL